MHDLSAWTLWRMRVAQVCRALLIIASIAALEPAQADDFRPPDLGKAILVNIPAFELIAYEDSHPVLRSRVIVGAPWHRTPRISTYTTAVRFRPTWRPTPSMIASGEYADRVWPPGERNPLGLAAVRLEPGLLVYLHDTNNRWMFEQDYRALSHGCVRVQKWAELAAFVLDIEVPEVMQYALGTRTFDAPAPPIPVELGYYTRFPDASGHMITYPDVYKLRDDAQSVDRLLGEQQVACADAAPRAPNQ